MQSKRIFTLGAGLLAASIGISAPASAANWLKLQGTQPASAGPRAKVWGFIQPEYQQTDGTKIKAGPWAGEDAIFNTIRPDLDSESSFNIIRARIGVRGTAMPIDSNVDYFLLAELGNNGITNEGGGSVKLTDASLTLNHFRDAVRVRVGQFKYPGGEEGLQAIHVFNYINFTNVTNQVLLERFFDADQGQTTTDSNALNGPVGAFRDVGVQAFNWFKQGDWEHSYAVMVGNGNGITRGDNNDQRDFYLYWSSARIFGGRGPRRQDWKLFAWYQDGERTLIDTNGTRGTTGDDVERNYDRTRWGVGTTYLKGKWRAAAEYVKAEGVIFNGSRGGAVPGTLNGGGVAADFRVLPADEADGWYVDVGYKVLPKVELDLRYDVLNRGTETTAGERKFETWTLGGQYFINKKTRFLLNYEIRDAEAPSLAGNAVPNRILDSMDDRISAQLLVIY